MDSYPQATFQCAKRANANRYFSKKTSVNEEGGTIAFSFCVFLFPLQTRENIKVGIVNINGFAHVVKVALQLYDLEDFVIVTDCSFYWVFKVSL